jgi:hypothetical protein
VRLGPREVRFRLSPSEFEDLQGGVPVETVTDFGAGERWIFRVSVADNAREPFAIQSGPGALGLIVSQDRWLELAARLPSRDGIGYIAANGLSVLLQVDIRRGPAPVED